jgi:hypothetical protein
MALILRTDAIGRSNIFPNDASPGWYDPAQFAAHTRGMAREKSP